MKRLVPIPDQSEDVQRYIAEGNPLIGGKTVGTCYANAVALSFAYCSQRIVGREDTFADIQDSIINRYGVYGFATQRVLEEVAPIYRQETRVASIDECRAALLAGRACVMTFSLTPTQWHAFGEFFSRSPCDVIGASDLPAGAHDQAIGHACCIDSYDEEARCFLVANSWGPDFADGRFFRVRVDNPLPRKTQHDVFFRQIALDEKDLLAYCRHLQQRTDEAVHCKEGVRHQVQAIGAIKAETDVLAYLADRRRGQPSNHASRMLEIEVVHHVARLSVLEEQLKKEIVLESLSGCLIS